MKIGLNWSMYIIYHQNNIIILKLHPFGAGYISENMIASSNGFTLSITTYYVMYYLHPRKIISFMDNIDFYQAISKL